MKILKFKIKTYKNSILQEGKCPLPNLPDQVLGHMHSHGPKNVTATM